MGSIEAMIISVSATGFEYNTGKIKFVMWFQEEKLNKLEHSTDRINWKPCTVTEPEEQ